MGARREGAGGPDGEVRILPFLGRADEARAEVWLRCEGPPCADGIDGADGIVVTGSLTGPHCTVASTLPTAVPLVDQGAAGGRPPLARAVCTEPAFWTPDVPHLYRADVELSRGGRVVAAGSRSIGLRRCGMRGGALWLDGRRYVPRGVRFRGTKESIEALRGLAAVALVDAVHVSETLLAAADRLGVGVVVHAGPGIPPSAIPSLVDDCAAHPSVLVMVLPDAAGLGRDALARALERRRGTMLLGQAVDGLLAPRAILPGIDLAVVTLPSGAVPHPGWRGATGVPRVALEAFPNDATPEILRQACDRLQARLAAWAAEGGPPRPADWAGYFVDSGPS